MSDSDVKIVLERLALKLRSVGANIPAPRTMDAIKDAHTGGLSIALLLIQEELDAINKSTIREPKPDYE